MNLQKERLLLNNQAISYIPNGKIEKFIHTVNDNFISVISAANGVGKTAAGCNVVANICYGVQNKYFDLPLFKSFPYPKQGRIVSNTKTIEETICGGQKELEKWLPKNRYSANKGGKSYNSHFHTDTGFDFDVMTYEQSVEEFESKTLGWCWFDEPPPREIFKATVARMRKGGVIFITETPLANASWMYDEIITKPEKGQRDFIQADIEDNCKEHGIRGILDHKYIEKMISEYDVDEREARIHGRFQHLVGRVFKKFDRKVHVIKPFTIKKQDFVVWEALDPHPRNPDAVLWIGVNKQKTYFVVNELYGKFRTTELAERVKRKAENYRIEERLIDPAAFVENQHEDNPTQATLAYRLSELGLDYMKATKDRDAANRRIADALDFEERGDKIILPPELYIFDTCQRTIWEIEHWQYDEWHGKTADRKSPKEKPEDKNDHMIECLGRILVQEPVWTHMPRETTYHGEVRTTKQFDPYD